ncbi:hypothetical protein [Allonocardiopsis opalescens]|uniref:Uncharacterized protein n=1 Tax=Allonocardiopsis opalescens TaxID=1144618 RepID=A0A2T0PSU5_9ACTN|nr:hypothetical protein [Allonocardiopsis opalescens]PRX91969.1 hypothetical protein CLV72_11242 [Allonocardiopsis opalescens]
MSGGSHNYLCWTSDLEELTQKQTALREMADDLAALGYADDAARETEELLVMLRQWQNRAEVRIRRLSEVWRALEWWHSDDINEDAFREALTKYRGDAQRSPS